MERSRLGLPGFLFSAAIGLATLAGMGAGIVTPAPAPPPSYQQTDTACSVAEVACGYGFDISGVLSLRRAEAAPRR